MVPPFVRVFEPRGCVKTEAETVRSFFQWPSSLYSTHPLLPALKSHLHKPGSKGEPSAALPGPAP